jgi:hypothetical protein
MGLAIWNGFRNDRDYDRGRTTLSTFKMKDRDLRCSLQGVRNLQKASQPVTSAKIFFRMKGYEYSGPSRATLYCALCGAVMKRV